MIEYWLQKKSLGGWSTVTWYGADELDKAMASFKACVGKEGLSGYSWRLVSVTVVEQAMLDEVVEVEPPEIKLPISPRAGEKLTVTNNTNKPMKITGWGSETVLAPKSSWDSKWSTEKPSSGWGDIPSDSSKPDHGLIGSVWLIHHKDKKKCRVPAIAVDGMLKLGYERGGPKTKFRE